MCKEKLCRRELKISQHKSGCDRNKVGDKKGVRDLGWLFFVCLFFILRDFLCHFIMTCVGCRDQRKGNRVLSTLRQDLSWS